MDIVFGGRPTIADARPVLHCSNKPALSTEATAALFQHFLKKSARPRPSNANSPCVQVDKSEEPFSWAAPDIDGLRALCQRVLGWDRVQSDGLLMPMVKVRVSQSKVWLFRFVFDCQASLFISSSTRDFGTRGKVWRLNRCRTTCLAPTCAHHRRAFFVVRDHRRSWTRLGSRSRASTATS